MRLFQNLGIDFYVRYYLFHPLNGRSTEMQWPHRVVYPYEKVVPPWLFQNL